MTKAVPNTLAFNAYKNAWHADLIESDIDEINELIGANPLLHETLVLRDSALAIKDIKRMYYSCILGDVEKVCGWSREIFLSGGVDFYVSQIPAEELQGLEEMTRLISQYVVTLNGERAKNFRAIFDYKLTRSDGRIGRIIQESSALKRDAKGNVLFFLILVSDISSLKRDRRQHLRLTDGQENLLYEVDNATGKCRQLEAISKRELEIIRLSGQNMTSKAIAEKLFISPHTVNTHRQNMLRKFGMTDTMELINFLIIYRLL
ncbi:response regulator transcription factor [Persicitalea sp.]|uniref:helix-turn-helix transcriptional regulator n=1 Tax=Persicitalea sp. TaxID=3100273 RepID=UPI003593A158